MTENKRMLDLEEERDYYKTKCASLETGMFNLEKENEQLKSELDYWKKQALLFERFTKTSVRPKPTK